MTALRGEAGKVPVVLHVHIAGKGVAQITVGDDLKVSPGEALIGEIERIAGRGTVTLG
jgi:hypothetical protein